MRRFMGLIFCLSLLAPGPALAERPVTIAYHGLRFLGLEPAQEASFQEAIARALQQARGVKPAPARIELSESCQRDVMCHCRAGREQGAARVLFGNIGRIGETFTFELSLLDTQSCAVPGSVFVSETHDGASARMRLGALVAKLTTPQEAVSQTVVKDERDVDAVPAMVSVFTGQQLRLLGIRTLPELLHFVPGFEANDTNWGEVVLLHGLEETTLMLLDGIPLSNPLFGFRDFNHDLSLSLRHLQRIEFVRGPGSVLYGANAFLGMVNFITSMPTATGPQVTAEASFGTLPTVDLFTSVEQSHRWFRYHLSASFLTGRGPGSFVDDSPWGYDESGAEPVLHWGNGGFTDSSFDYYYDIMARLEVLKRLQLGVSIVDHRHSFEISPMGSLLAPDQGGQWSKWHRLYTLAWEEQLRHGFKLRLSGSRYEYRFWENFVAYPASPLAYPAGLRFLQGNEDEPLLNHLVEARAHHTFQRGIVGNQALIGVQYLHQRIPDLYAAQTGIREAPTLGLDISSKTFHTVAGYLQDELSLWDFLILSGGLRVEHRDPSFGTVLLSQGAALLRWSRFNAKLVYAEGFRPPRANDLFSTVGTLGNLALRPERSRALSGEAGTRLGPFWMRVGGMVTWITDLITYDSVEGTVYNKPVNKGSTTIAGGYAEAGLEWSPRLSVFANYSYKHLWEEMPGEADRRTPVAPQTASLGVSVRPLNDLSVYLTGHLTGPRTVRTYIPNTQGEVRDHKIGVAADISLGAWLTNLFRQFDVGLKVQNPFGFIHRSPYQLDGDPNYILEWRRNTEVLLTLRWSRSFDTGQEPPRPAPLASAP